MTAAAPAREVEYESTNMPGNRPARLPYESESTQTTFAPQVRDGNLQKAEPPKDTPSSYAGKLRGKEVTLPDVGTKQIQYTKRDREEYTQLRSQFDSKARPDFMKQLANDPKTEQQLKKAGLSDESFAKMRSGKTPDGWEVHHKIPLDDGGSNDVSNLVLVKTGPQHLVLSNAQRNLVGNLRSAKQKRLISLHLMALYIQHE